MLTEQLISITDLRKDATSIIKNLSLPKYIFVNNKPKAVVMDMEEYETLKKQAFMQTMQEEVKKAKKSWKKYTSVDSFMDDLLHST